MLGWFDAKEAKLFGESLAELFLKRVPQDGGVKESEAGKKVDKAMGEMATQIRRFVTNSQRLNLYKRAQLGNAFKWKLQEAGVNGAYVHELTKWVMVQLVANK